jgi:hypothetical protein
MLAVRIGQLTAEVFHLLDLRRCRPLPDFAFSYLLFQVSFEVLTGWNVVDIHEHVYVFLKLSREALS